MTVPPVCMSVKMLQLVDLFPVIWQLHYCVAQSEGTKVVDPDKDT